MSTTQRLGRDNYQRPKQTFQDKLTEAEIKEKLKDYEKVDDISKVPVNTHLRYFAFVENPKTKKLDKLFRMGGCLKNKDNCEQYVILSNGTKSWSVNTKKSTFFKKMSTEEVHLKYQTQINELQQQLKKMNKKLMKESSSSKTSK
jgi:hypothetical protein